MGRDVWYVGIFSCIDVHRLTRFLKFIYKILQYLLGGFLYICIAPLSPPPFIPFNLY